MKGFLTIRDFERLTSFMSSKKTTGCFTKKTDLLNKKTQNFAKLSLNKGSRRLTFCAKWPIVVKHGVEPWNTSG